MTDIRLISTDKLVDELIDRTDGLVLGYIRTEEDNKPMVTTKWSNKATFLELIGLSNMLQYQLNLTYYEEEWDKDE